MGLSPGGFERYDHITQKAADCGSPYAVVLGEGDDIRGPVSPEVGLIELFDLLIIQQKDAQLSFLTARVF